VRLIIVASSISFFTIISLLELSQKIITFAYGKYYELKAAKDKGKAEVRNMT